jgi:ribonuclease P protein component
MVAKTPHFVLHRACLNARPPEGAKGVHGSKSLFPQQTVWLGAMVPKRWARRAVTRNAIKRQIYSMGMNGLADFAPAAFVVRLRRDFSRVEFISASSVKLTGAVRAELQDLLQQAARRAAVHFQ